MIKFTQYERNLLTLVLESERRYAEIAKKVCNIFNAENDSDLIDFSELLYLIGLDNSDLSYEIIIEHNAGRISTSEAINAIELFVNGKIKESAEVIGVD